MKNKLIKIFTTFICLIFVLFGYLAGGKAEQFDSASALSFSCFVSDEENSEQTAESTPFLVDPTLMTISSSVSDEENSDPEKNATKIQYIFVYDKADGLLKAISKQTNDFRETNTVFKPEFEPTKIDIVSGVILLSDSSNDKLQAVDQTNFTVFEIDLILKVQINQAHKVLIVNIGGEDKILLCPENPLQDNFKLVSLEEVNQENGLKIKSSIEFKISQRYSNFPSYDHIYACENQGNLFLMLANNDSFLSFEYDISEANNEITLSKAVNGFSQDDMHKLAELNEILFEDGKMLAMQIENAIQIYSLEIKSTSTELTHLSDKDISIESKFDKHFSVKENTLALLSSEKQELKIYTFNGQTDNFTVSSVVKKNPNISTTYWFNNDKYHYVYATEDVSLFDYPYSKTEIVTAPQGQAMLIIGNGTIAESQKSIVGYNYVLYTANDRNYYGYVKSESLAELEKTNATAQKVTVLTNTALLKFPSYARDSVNTEIALLPATSDVSVVQGESGLYSYSAKGVKFLRVIVKIGDQTLEGFIDQSRARERTATGEKVITNASINSDNTEIFVSESAESDIITFLDEGARVKIIGKRNTKNNFTKISFNDKAGNTHTGYVYTYNLETDTWTMLQIFGMALIILNTILLIVIICVKNKVTK